MAVITTKHLVKVLKAVPEKKFRIAELAPELLDASGKVDVAKAIDRQPEINMAILEVETYVKSAKAVAGAMESISDEPFEGFGDSEDEEAA